MLSLATRSAMNAEETLTAPELPQAAGLRQYLEYAGHNNPGLRAAFNKFKAALEKVPQARALPDPRLNIGYFLSPIETRVGPQQAKVGLMQMFPWTGKRGTRAEGAVRGAEAAYASFEAEKLKLFYLLEEAYWNYWYLARVTAVTEENMKLLNYLESVARTKYSAGDAPHSAVIKAQVELGKLEERLKELADRRAPMSARLHALLGRAADELLPWPSDEPPVGPAVPVFETLAAAMLEQNPELAASVARVAEADAAIALARRNYYPDVGLGLDYVFTGDNPTVPDSGKDALMATLSLNLPLGIGKYRAAEREAKAVRSAATAGLENRWNTLLAELRMALFDLRDATRKESLYRDTLLPKARQSLSVAQQAFEAGKADFLDIIDAERTLLAFELAEARAKADAAIASAKLNTLTAGKGPAAVKNEEQGEAR